MVSLRIPSIPTSNDVGFLPRVLSSLDSQLKALDVTIPANQATTKQRLTAWATGSVAVALLSVVDEVAHLSCFVLKAPGVGIKQLAKITNLSKYVDSPALDVKDWLNHLEKARSVLAVAVTALLYSLSLKQDRVVLIAKDVQLLTTDSGKGKKTAASVAPAASTAS